MAIYALRVSDDGKSKWVVRAGSRHFHVVKGDMAMVNILAMPHQTTYKCYDISAESLKEATFGSDVERMKVTSALWDILSLSDDYRGEPHMCTKGSYETLVKWCEGDDIV